MATKRYGDLLDNRLQNQYERYGMFSVENVTPDELLELRISLIESFTELRVKGENLLSRIKETAKLASNKQERMQVEEQIAKAEAALKEVNAKLDYLRTGNKKESE